MLPARDKKMHIDVASQGFSVDEARQRILQRWTRLRWFKRSDPQIKYVFTFYYPYFFSEWKVIVPRYIFKDAKALIRVGVNGRTALAAQTEIWPENKRQQIDPAFVLPVKVTAEEVNEEQRRCLKNVVYRAMRPLQAPRYELSREQVVYLPYYVFLANSKFKSKIVVLEALTGTDGEVNTIPGLDPGWLEKKMEEFNVNLNGERRWQS
ncbi:hypothetical protein J2S00_000920 [Caldalkalibacillus uzonensis]|uniref:Uncharacterized protein n=1 Tax=Caldalkalibacillus uzonensis TaxID=353224 RepID=A0ABU0CNZ7_9BACI|nr:hypothetical protein [Caldalkalibacillus uzonensis]MDQ0338137.1 hypothetical protein [Caldalkalibacillus uzonensis]